MIDPRRLDDLDELPRADGTPLEPDILMLRDVIAELVRAVIAIEERLEER